MQVCMVLCMYLYIFVCVCVNNLDNSGNVIGESIILIFCSNGNFNSFN